MYARNRSPYRATYRAQTETLRLQSTHLVDLRLRYSLGNDVENTHAACSPIASIATTANHDLIIPAVDTGDHVPTSDARMMA